jgi:uncharacterized integral membrane protein
VRRFLNWLVLVPAALILGLFAVANRHPTRLDFDPLPAAFELPLFAVVFAALFLGLLLGYVVSWFAGGRRRRAAREVRRALDDAQKELVSLRADAARPAAPGAPSPSAQVVGRSARP